MFPILISAPSRPLFFTRDADDNFDIDIASVNNGTYNPLKLHRVSFFIDVGLEGGSPMGFGFDGSMLVPRTPSVSNPDSAIDCFNRVKAAMMLGGLALDATSLSMIGFGQLNQTGYFRYAHALGAEAQISFALQQGGAGSINIRLIEPHCLTEEETKSAYTKGNKIFGLLSNLNSAFLTFSYSCLKRFETRNALIFGWVAIEQVLEQIWKDVLLTDAKYYLTDQRRASLRKLQNIAQKIEILSQAKVISIRAYEKLSTARKARNKFTHQGGRVAFHDALDCVSGLMLIIQEYTQLHNISAETEHLMDVFHPSREELLNARDTIYKDANEIDWDQVKYYRELNKIPGDELWDGDESELDGIALKRALDE